MKNIIVIAKNTFKELIRNRVLYSFLLFAIFLVLMTVAVGQLSYTEQLRLTMSLGLACIHMCIMGLTVFLGGSIIYKEIERLTILTILSRPISRSHFLIGKYLGFSALILSFSLGFYVVFCLNLLLLGFDFNKWDMFVAFVGIVLEAVTLLSVTTFFSTFCASFLTILFSIGMFLVAHWTLTVKAAHADGTRNIFYYVIVFVKKFLPNFEHFNWRLNALEPFVTTSIASYGIAIAAVWVTLFLIMASLIFRTKDFA
ncbi:MAG: ABC transporter permease [Bdellovibrionaceae bacterium]|nr:ABC transporter permease [Pseudobdellovibrionaceae bacterium]